MYRKFRPNCYNFVMEEIYSIVIGYIISTILYRFHAYKFVLRVCRYISAITLTKVCSIDGRWALTSFCGILNTPKKLGYLYPYYAFLQLKKFKHIIKLCNTYWINVCPVFISFTQMLTILRHVFGLLVVKKQKKIIIWQKRSLFLGTFKNFISNEHRQQILIITSAGM